jgi:hypothetical protein
MASIMVTLAKILHLTNKNKQYLLTLVNIFYYDCREAAGNSCVFHNLTSTRLLANHARAIIFTYFRLFYKKVIQNFTELC